MRTSRTTNQSNSHQIALQTSAMGGAGEGDGQTEPLLEKLSNSSSSEIDKRTGTAWTATAHIITAVIGSGVLSLAWSVAQLGWVGGPAAMVLFAGVTLVQSSLLADCYIFHDPDNGVVRNRSYVDAVRFYLGEKSQWFCGFFLNINFFGSGVVYTLTSATSMRQELKVLLRSLQPLGYMRYSS
uniref:Amino acid transporter transmembrane domain-containing protein n=2 Tax=Oryza glumipatula TaxID=40148 RepID=A0A0D9YXK1_9ORYZ